MILPIRAHYLKLQSEFYEGRCNSDHPEIWELDEEEIAYMEQIKTVDDLLNYTPSSDGKMQALVYGCALAMGLSQHDAMSAANDH